jgi:predicted transcriptional regulator
MQRVTASIPAELGAALEERAQAEDRSASAVVRRALAEHLQASPSQVVAAPDGSRLVDLPKRDPKEHPEGEGVQ